MEKPSVALVPSETQLMRYGSEELAVRAAKRAMRWLRAPRNRGARPPGHIAQKMRLMKVVNHGD